MGVFFNDPDVGLDDMYWYNNLALMMRFSMEENEGLIAFDDELNTYSCCVELHRIGQITYLIRINFISG